MIFINLVNPRLTFSDLQDRQFWTSGHRDGANQFYWNANGNRIPLNADAEYQNW